MSTARIYNATDISADTGEIGCTGLSGPPPLPAQDYSEQMVALRLRIKTHTVGVGRYLVSVRYNDGVGDQSWDVSLDPTLGNYVDVGQDLWVDASRNVTVQVVPLVAGGSVDVRLLGSF